MKGPTLYIPRLLLEHPLLLPALALVVGICLEDVFYAQLVGRSTTFLLLAFGFGVSTMFMLRKRALEMVALVALISAFARWERDYSADNVILAGSYGPQHLKHMKLR